MPIKLKSSSGLKAHRLLLRPLYVMMTPHTTIMIVIHTDGRKNFRTMLDGTSKNEYGMKKIVKQRLYCPGVKFRPCLRPMMAALPTLMD